MSNELYLKAAFQKLNNVLGSGDFEEIEKAKYDCIYEATNFFEAAIVYVTLEQYGQHFDFGSYTIPKGTILYRIREYKEDTDFSKPSEWTPPPHRPMNRANREGEEALYLNAMEAGCLLETHIAEGQKYVLGTYEVTEDIVVGGYLSIPNGNKRLFSIGIALNAILIAPARNERNKELFEFLDDFYREVIPDDIQWDDIIKNNFWLPFKLAVMNRREKYHNITNVLCDILKRNYPDGVKFSSCYMPVETIGIVSNCYNLALYEAGIRKLKFVKHEIKTNLMKDFTSTNVAKLILQKKS